MSRCHICNAWAGPDDLCYSCQETRDKLVDKLGEEVFDAIVDIARRMATNMADQAVDRHEKDNEHTRKDWD